MHLPPKIVRPVAGFGAVLLVLLLALTVWPGVGAVPDKAAVAAADVQWRNAAQAAAALRDVESHRADLRASRDRTTSVAPTTPPAKPEPVPSVVGKRWVTTNVNVRSGPSTAADRIGSLKAVTQIGITGVTRSGWSQVVSGGKAGWVKSTYLSTSKPKVTSAPSGVSDAPCPISSGIESGLTSNARAVYRSVCAAFPHTVSSFLGYRAGDSGDHGSGRAVDIMVSGDPGREIARYVQAHAGQLGVTYVIYQQKIWLAGNPTSQWKLMEDRGSPTANHYDHVHVSVS
ncbi:MAG: SH3 domain-containing protein [Kineosporiaceae bacterium]